MKVTSSAVYSDYGNYLTESINELGETTSYNYDSVTKLLKYVENANNVRTAYTYDNRDRTTKVYLDADKDGIPDTAEAQVAYLYANNRLSGIDTATTDYTLTYDAFGNVLTIKAGNYTLATYEYASNNGKLLKLTYGNGDYEQYIYDSLERLVEVKLNGATEYIVKYDNNGRLYSLTENGATHIYEYDSLDRLVRAWQEDGNGETIISVENFYDSLGRPTGSAYGDVSATPQQYSITYKADSNLIDTYTMPGNKVNTYSYDGFERLTQKTHSSNVYTTQYGYLTTTEGNTSSLVSRMDIDSSAIDTYFTYTYDNLGNIVKIRQNGTVIESYEYDSLGQLTRANNLADNTSMFYQYDKAGNILYKFKFAYTTEATSNIALAGADEIVAYQYTYSGWGDLLSRYGYNGTLISYDEIGNPLNWRNATGLTWEARQLQSITLSETKSLAFEYNSSGIRTKKTYVDTSGDTWQHSYTLDGSKIIKEAVYAFATGSPAAGMHFDLLYYYDDSGIAAVSYDGTKYYYVKNLQGDVIGLVNASGQYVVQYVYDAWGRVVSTTGSMASTLGQYNPFRYRGYYYDRETGFYYLQSRYYDPTVGRFINADHPELIGANGGIEGYNLFAYCNNNPILSYDIDGRFIKSAIKWLSKNVFEPIVDSVEEYLSDKDGTLTVGQSVGFSPGIFSFAAQMGTTLDTDGNLALQWGWTDGFTTASAGAETTSFISISNAPTYKQLEGTGGQIGGSTSVPIPNTPISAVNGADVNFYFDENNNECYEGFSLKSGIATNSPEVHEVHLVGGDTHTICHVNLFDLFDNIFSAIEEW